MQYIPSSPNKGVAPEWTSWETFFKPKLEADRPFDSSFVLSNLGALFGGGKSKNVQALPGLRDLVWAQAPDALLSAITLQVVGQALPDGKGSLSINITWQKEVLSQKVLEDFVVALRKIMNFLIAGEIEAVWEDATFGSIAALLGEQENV